MMLYTDTTPRVCQPGLAFIQRIRLRAARRVLWLHRLWADDCRPAAPDVAIAPGEVHRLLLDPYSVAEAEEAFYQTDATARDLGQQIEAVETLRATDAAWTHLCRLFDLSGPESDLLALAVAAELEPGLRRLYGYLNDDATLCYPTLCLAASLFQWPAGSMIGPDSALVRWRLARTLESGHNPWGVMAPWVADPSLVLWIAQGSSADPILGSAVHVLAHTQQRQIPCVYPQQFAALVAFVHAMGHQGHRPLELELVAPTGTGKRTLAWQFCASMQRDTLAVDASVLLGPEVSLALATERALRVLRMARLVPAVVYWYAIEGVDLKVWQAVAGQAALMLFGAETPRPGLASGVPRQVVRLPELSRALRQTVWQHYTDQPLPAVLVDWSLTPAELEQAAQVIPAGSDVVIALCRQMLSRLPGELFAPLPCPYTWDDLVLSAPVRDHLAELEAQARLRGAVYEEWGFDQLCPTGKGITALFAGPSGTGKTMAAQVLARSLGRELYRVDLSGVVNKYIGETEKRLKQVFDACERAGVVLFFDEADALFGQRTKVKDAHDRFANIEIDYLLQRMEQFDGLAILATNRKGDLDTAFLRRLRFIVEFMPPGPVERLAIWQRALRTHSPSGEALLDPMDWDFLAAQLDMTGAGIKAAALAAAFLARAQGSRITMHHVLHAARRELSKHGVVVRAGAWGGQAEDGLAY